MWRSVIVQLVGLAIDAVWHGVVRPGVEPGSVEAMVVHLLTVHLVLYLGVAGLLVSTVWAVVARPRSGAALPVALVGSLVQTLGESWHAAMHLRLRPDPAPEVLAYGGLVIVVAALLADRHRRAHDLDRRAGRRRAA
jgi:uncharacterized oligopeptide transporter (OPT) family protein